VVYAYYAINNNNATQISNFQQIILTTQYSKAKKA